MSLQFQIKIAFFCVGYMFAQPKTPQPWGKLSILLACCNLSTSCNEFINLSSCKKPVKIRFVAICHFMQIYYNLLKQLAASLLLTSLHNQLATGLLSTTSCRKPCERILISACWNKLLRDVNGLVAICAFLAFVSNIKLLEVSSVHSRMYNICLYKANIVVLRYLWDLSITWPPNISILLNFQNNLLHQNSAKAFVSTWHYTLS